MIKRVNEVFPDWLEGGIFTELEKKNVPWKGSLNSKELDIAYHGGHSGDKIISPLVDKLLTNEELTEQSKTMLISSILAVYGRNWEKLWQTLTFEYNPIENYSMIETETFTGETSFDGVTSGNDTTNGNNTVTATNTNSNNVYGFNSDTAVGADSALGSNNETGTIENTSTTETTTNNTGTTTNNKTLTRSGNIGATTSQQMIESERELWNWYFFDIVFRDIDKMLTLSIY